MITSNNKLLIFDQFQIDYTLPKYNKGETVELVSSITTNTFRVVTGSVDNATFGSSIGNPIIWNQLGGESEELKSKEKVKFWNNWFSSKKKKSEEKKKTMTILNFFSSLAQSLNDLKTVQDIAIHYEIAITNAAKAGQTALVDKLKTRLESSKSEVQLVMLELNKFLIEDQVVDFYKKTNSDKKLKLTWLKNFIKPLPSKVLELKETLDKQYIFDNYVILHYDPNDDATDLTLDEKKEIERRQKDPILFGVLKDSRRLYYIADWIDEYCNLTLDVVIETLGEKVNLINNDSVKTYIDLGERNDTRIKIPNPMTSTGMTYQMPVIFEKVKEKMTKPFKLLSKKIARKKKTWSLPKTAKKKK